MGKGILISVVVIVLIVIGMFAFFGNDKDKDLGDSLEGVQNVPVPGVIDGNTDEIIVNDDSNNKVKTNVIEMSSSGFSPKTLEINAGDIVIFKAVDNSNRWPASAMHPTHTVYPGSGINKCGTAEEEKIFDACGSVKQGETFTFTFNEVGNWKYHDHLSSGTTGEIIVE